MDAKKKKSDEELMLSEEENFKVEMIKKLKDPKWLARTLDEGASASKYMAEICQSLAKSLKVHSNQGKSKVSHHEFDAVWAAEVQQLVERHTQIDSLDSAAKLGQDE